MLGTFDYFIMSVVESVSTQLSHEFDNAHFVIKCVQKNTGDLPHRYSTSGLSGKFASRIDAFRKRFFSRCVNLDSERDGPFSKTVPMQTDLE
jgi:hypothetical protein